MNQPLIWVGYTTRYRKGSAQFARAARTLAEELRRGQPQHTVVLAPLHRKADFVAAMQELSAQGRSLVALHFIGHSGMYGIMFGSTSWPEQLSPHEWRGLSIPFAPGASAYFHACRTARWFAPFFARTFNVRTYGYQGYTSLSVDKQRFVFEGFRQRRGRPLYVVSVPGRKTHGWLGSVRKYALAPQVEPLCAFEPAPLPAAGYDRVAQLYDRAFRDVRVRRSEWSWLCARFDAAFASGEAPRVLDVGCGNGALLEALLPRLRRGVGVDVSERMVEQCQARAARHDRLEFCAIQGPLLPFADGSFDVITSFLSFRYLDWDPMLQEMRRVLAPGGRILIVDMVEQPLSLRDGAQFVPSLARHLLRRVRDRRFVRDVAALTRHPAWAEMLQHNPIRAAHEYRWYLESRFPGRRVQTLNVGRTTRLLAFDSGALEPGQNPPMSYP